MNRELIEMEDYAEKVEAEQTSKINSGMLINLRLNDLWKDAHRHARAGKYSEWNDDLDRVWCELGGDEKEVAKDHKNYDKSADAEYNKLTMAYADSCKLVIKKTGFNKYNSDDKVEFAKQKSALIKKEIFLRRLQNKQGKGTAYHDSSEDYMD